MSQTEFERLTKLKIATDLHWNELTHWERNFMEGLIERFDAHGINTKVTPGQWEIIEKIAEKIL